MLTMIRKMGFTSNIMYGMGFGSIGLSVVSWLMSRQLESKGIDRADRWGIFVGQWAPTFFALGCAMRLEEHWGRHEREDEMETMTERAREAMPVG